MTKHALILAGVIGLVSWGGAMPSTAVAGTLETPNSTASVMTPADVQTVARSNPDIDLLSTPAPTQSAPLNVTTSLLATQATTTQPESVQPEPTTNQVVAQQHEPRRGWLFWNWPKQSSKPTNTDRPRITINHGVYR